MAGNEVCGDAAVVPAQPRHGFRAQLVEAFARGMAGVAKSRDRPGTGQQQVAVYQVCETEVGVAGNEALDLFEGRFQLLAFDLLEDKIELCLGTVAAGGKVR